MDDVERTTGRELDKNGTAMRGRWDDERMTGRQARQFRMYNKVRVWANLAKNIFWSLRVYQYSFLRGSKEQIER